MFAYLFDHCDRDRGISPGGRDDSFKADLGMLVVCQPEEMVVSARKIFRPLTEKVRGGRPGVIIAVSGHLLEELGIDPTPLLMKP
jgi:hypothetical protein